MTLLRVKSGNHPQQVKKRGADDTRDDRRTPDDLWTPLNLLHGFTVDAAASAENAKVPRYWDLGWNGLLQPWKGERVWCNPPYSNIADWVEKADRETQVDCPLVVMLVPANRTEQRWWQHFIEPWRDHEDTWLRVKFLPGRIRFNRPGWTKPAKGDRPPFGLCLLIWDNPSIPDGALSGSPLPDKKATR